MTPVAQPSGRRQVVPWVAGIVVGSLITGVVVWSLRPAPPPQTPARFVVSAPPSPVPLPVSEETALAISPDGSVIVYRATVEGEDGLYVRHLDRLAGELLWSGSVMGVFFSADGAWVGFQTPSDQTLKKIPVLGGPAVTLCPTPAFLRGASWGPDDTIIFGMSGNQPLYRVSAAGGEPETLTMPDEEVSHRWPEVLPGGHAVLFTQSAGDAPQIAVLDLRTGEQRVVVPGGTHPRYVSSGHLVYGFEDTLRAVRFDPDRLEALSDPIPVLEGVTAVSGGGANVDISDGGALVYQWDPAGAAASRTLVWVDREGQEESIPMTPRAYLRPRLSPDGRRVAVDTAEGDPNLFLYDLDTQVEEQFTFDLGRDEWPMWSRDGSQIYFSSTRDGAPQQLYVKAADGSGVAEPVLSEHRHGAATGLSADGETLVFTGLSDTGFDIFTVRLGADGAHEPLLATPARDMWPTVSPNGRWLAYVSDETGERRVYARPFPDVASGGRRVVSEGLGERPLWGHDGREIFYHTADGVMVVSVETGDTFQRGAARRLFSKEPYNLRGLLGNWDISADGQRFQMVKRGGATGEDTQPSQIIVVQNWLEELTRLVPTP